MEERLDVYVANNFDISRTKAKKLIDDNKVLVNGINVNPSYKVKEDDEVEVIDDLDYEIKIEKENIPLDIVYEDEYLLIINKKSGMVVHPAPGNYSGTLVNALLYKFDLDGVGEKFRPGIVHRIDKDTSGLMIVAKTEKALEVLSYMIKNKEVKRTYIALVDGVINHDTGTIDAPIGRDKVNRQKMAVTDVNGKESITHFEVLKRYENNTLVKCILDTGRTHQIRVHFAYIGHPVTNDPVYGKETLKGFGQLLHSTSIEFTHPFTKKHIYFEVEAPKEFKDYIENL